METTGITEIDNFLPSELLAEVMAEFHAKASHQGPRPFLGALRPWFFRDHKERVVSMDLPSSVQEALDGFLTGSPVQPGGPQKKGASASAAITGHLNWGEHKDHQDVTCSGAEVRGEVCLLYLGGAGMLVLTDQAKETEHRIQIRPNVAVKWPNADFSHRVEASADDGPRMMLGPYTADRRGGLARTMSPKGMFTLGGGGGGGGLAQLFLFLLLIGGVGVIACGFVVQEILRVNGMGIFGRLTVAFGMILIGLISDKMCVRNFLFALAAGTLVSGALMNLIGGITWYPGQQTFVVKHLLAEL